MAVAGFISGFVTGSMVTGLSIKLLGDWWTEKRREWRRDQPDQALFDDVQAKMPDLIQAMRINLETYGLARQFYVLPNRDTSFGNTRLPIYYESDYQGLREKLEILRIYNYIHEERSKPDLKFIMTVAFVELVQRG